MEPLKRWHLQRRSWLLAMSTSWLWRTLKTRREPKTLKPSASAPQLSSAKIIEMFEGYSCYHGLYFYIGGRIAFSEDPNEHYKFIEAAARTGAPRGARRLSEHSF